jgi:hypothetical protein
VVFIISLVKGQCPVDGGRYERDVTEESSAPKWSGWRDVPRVVLHRPHLRKTATIALVVGTILFAINQLDVVVGGRADAVVWVKVGVTYLVPSCVSNAGVLVASRAST